jgi:ATP phosphoribosyltransferase
MDAARLKLAVQKAGRLTDPSLDLLARCGLKLSRGKDQLVGFGENLPLDVLSGLLRVLLTPGLER